MYTALPESMVRAATSSSPTQNSEFGHHDDEIILIDEILSPDSSRFWDRRLYEPGRGQDSFDKQFVRDYLTTLDWDKTPPALALPDDIVQRTLSKYSEARDRLIG